MFLSILAFICYFSLFPVSSQLLASNPSSLLDHSSTIFFNPSLLGEKTKLELSLASYTFLESFKVYSLAFSYKKVALGMCYAGTKDLNEKFYVFGFSRKLKDVDFGLSISINERVYENFVSRQLNGVLAFSKSSEDLTFGASLLKNLSENTLNLFAVLNESIGRTFIDYIFYSNERTLSLSQEFKILPFLSLSLGFSRNPDQYFAGISANNYIKPALSIRYLQNLGYLVTSGIEYTF
jgi:hypothetical protein